MCERYIVPDCICKSSRARVVGNLGKSVLVLLSSLVLLGSLCCLIVIVIGGV